MFQRLIAVLFVSDVTAGESRCYPELQPVVARASREQILDAVRRALEAGGPDWSVTEIDDRGNRVDARVHTPVPGFGDDVTVRLESPPGEPGDAWIVRARSRSRWSPVDLGRNARNLRRFYQRLESIL